MQAMKKTIQLMFLSFEKVKNGTAVDITPLELLQNALRIGTLPYYTYKLINNRNVTLAYRLIEIAINCKR